MPEQTTGALYFDHNATTPLDPDVLEAMLPYLRQHFGNASSTHAFGQAAADGLEAARRQVADFLGADPQHVVFTSGGSEALNHAIKGLAFANLEGPKRILFGATEHHAVEGSARWLSRLGFVSEVLPVDEMGRVLPETVARALEAGPALLVAVMWANNEVGTLQDIAGIGAVCRSAGVAFLSDAVQAAGKVPIRVEDVDLLAIGGHKIYGPKGVGALYIRPGLKIEPLIHGAGHEAGRRAGTSVVAAVVGMGQASAMAQRRLEADMRTNARLRDRLEKGILAALPEVTVHARGVPRLPNTSSLSFAGVSGLDLQSLLDMQGMATSTGAACRSGVLKPSPVLLAMGVSPALALGTVRLSLGRSNTEAQVDRAVHCLQESVEGLRNR